MCTSEHHESQKKDPAQLAEHFTAHAEPWHLGGAVLLLYTCRRCHSTIAVEAGK